MMTCTVTLASTCISQPSVPGSDVRENRKTFLLVHLEALTNYCTSLYLEAQMQQLALGMDDPYFFDRRVSKKGFLRSFKNWYKNSLDASV